MQLESEEISVKIMLINFYMATLLHFKFLQCLWTKLFTFSNYQIVYSLFKELLGNTLLFGNAVKGQPVCVVHQKSLTL